MAPLSDPGQRRAPLALQTLLLLLLAAVIVIFLCATAAAIRKLRNCVDRCRERSAKVMVGATNANERAGEAVLCSWAALKKALVMSLRGREGNEVVESETREQLPEAAGRGSPLMPLWRRRVLMGERCELPRFSGLVLYDERGRPACSSSSHGTLPEVKPTPAVTALKDLL